VRFFAENAEGIPLQDMVGPVHELEEQVQTGLSSLAQLLRDLQSVVVSGPNEVVKRGLTNFVTMLLTRLKAQFSMSRSLHQRLLESHPRFSPRSSPLHFLTKNADAVPQTDLDAL
jgi:hypothetical protein